MRIQPYERRLGINPVNIPSSTPNIDNGDYGAGVAEGIQGLALRIQKLQNDTDDARTLELFNRFKQNAIDYHDNPDTGIRNTRLGYMASGLYQDADTWMRSKGEEYVQELKSNRAKRNFRKMAEPFIIQQGDANSRFEAQQVKHYQTEQADASIKNSIANIERHYNEPDVINLERESIRQALELKMRGSSLDAFEAEYAKIEDQIGLARIRQAYSVDPLDALAMMQNPDIHLLPETQAKLREYLKGKTEIYRLTAIAQAYAKYYTPENAEAAHQDLIQRYGPDEGSKIFSALNHFWQIGNMQRNARQNQLNEFQKNNAENFIRRLNDPNATPVTRDEVLDAQRQNHINPQFAQSMLHAIDAREQNDQKKLKEYNERLVRIAVDSGVKFSREQAIQLYSQDIIGDVTKNYIFESIDKRSKSENQNLLEAQRVNAENFYKRIIRNDPNDKVTLEELNHALEDKAISPEKHKTLSDYIKAQNKLTALDEKQKRGREIIANADKGVFDSPDELERQYVAGEIPDSAYSRVIAIRRQQDAQNAKSEKEKHEADLDVLAEQLSRIYPVGHTQEFIDYLRDNNIPIPDIEYLTRKYNQHISMQEKAEKERQAAWKEISEAKYKVTYAAAREGVHMSSIELTNAFLDGEFSKEQVAELDRLREADERKQLKAIEELKKQTKEQNKHEIWIDAMNGKFRTLDELNDLAKHDKLDYSDVRSLYSFEQNYKKARAKAELEFWKDRMNDIAKDLADKFPLGSEQNAYEEMNKYSRTEREAIKRYYDGFIQEQRTAKQNQDKEKALKQEKKYNSFHEWWKDARPVPEDILNNMLRNEEITPQQYENALAHNKLLDVRAGVEDDLIKYMGHRFTSLTRTERERLIMQHMGVNEDLHKAEFTYLYQKVIEGTATDAMIDWSYAHGRITTDDKEELKKYESKFEREQKNAIQQKAMELQLELQKMRIPGKDRRLYEDLAVTDFYNATRFLDPHAKNFNDALQNAYATALTSTITAATERFPITSWGSKTPFGKRVEQAQQNLENYSNPRPNPQITYRSLYGNEQTMNLSGDIAPFNNSVEISPPPPAQPQPVYNWDIMPVNSPLLPYIDYNDLLTQPQQIPQSIQAPQQQQTQSNQNNRAGQSVNVGSEMVSGSTITGRFNDWRAYRNGKHNGTDYAVKEGTPIVSPDIGVPLTVSKVRTSNPSRGGGNSVVLTTTDVEGNTYDFIVSHMQNGSIPLKAGDLVLPGAIIGRVGNTGMTSDRKKGGITAWYEGKSSGYHMDLKIKKNGKYIDPEKFVIPTFANNPAQQNNNIQPQPQPNIEPFTPLVSSDAEFERAAIEILSLDVNPLWGDISGDIAAPNPYGFGGFLNARY